MIDVPRPLSDAERRAQEWHDEHHRDRVPAWECPVCQLAKPDHHADCGPECPHKRRAP